MLATHWYKTPTKLLNAPAFYERVKPIETGNAAGCRTEPTAIIP
jgi:hypothetical protein